MSWDVYVYAFVMTPKSCISLLTSRSLLTLMVRNAPVLCHAAVVDVWVWVKV
jgi:hypothetical protein